MNGNPFRNSYNLPNKMPFSHLENMMNFQNENIQQGRTMEPNSKRQGSKQGIPKNTYADAYLNQRMEYMKKMDHKKNINRRYQNANNERYESSSPKQRKINYRPASSKEMPRNQVVQSAEGIKVRIQTQDPNTKILHESLSNTNQVNKYSFAAMPNQNNSLENSRNVSELERKMRLVIQENDRLIEENTILKNELKSANSGQTNSIHQPSNEIQKQIQLLKKENEFLKQYALKNENELSKNKSYLNQKLGEIQEKDVKIDNLKNDVNILNSKVTDLSQTLNVVKNEVFKNKHVPADRNWSGVYEGTLIGSKNQTADRINRII